MSEILKAICAIGIIFSGITHFNELTMVGFGFTCKCSLSLSRPETKYFQHGLFLGVMLFIDIEV